MSRAPQDTRLTAREPRSVQTWGHRDPNERLKTTVEDKIRTYLESRRPVLSGRVREDA